MSLKCGADILVFYKDIPMYYRLEDTCASEIVELLSRRFGVVKDSLDITCDAEDKITSTILENGKPIGLIGWDEEM